MDLQHPLRSMIPSLDSAVLEVLAGARSSMGVSQITRLAPKGTRPGIATVLDRLVEHGLVLSEAANQGHLYRLNRDHLLAPSVLQAAAARATLVQRLTDLVHGLEPQPVHASLFGSFARGDADEKSDVDVLLVAATSRDAARWEAALDLLKQRVLLWTGNRCQCVILSASRVRELSAAQEPIVANWLEDGLVLTGLPLGDVIRRTAGVRR